MSDYTEDDVEAGRAHLLRTPRFAPEVDQVRAVLDAVVPAIVARAKAEALREAADKWAHGQWADAPRRADRIEERIANAQHVADWLRARAEQVEHTP